MAAAGFALLAVTLFSFIGATTWLGELTTHFRPQFAVAAVVILACSLALRARWGLAAAGLALAANVIPLLPVSDAAVPLGEGVPFRVIVLNLQGEAADLDRVQALIERERPDLVVLTEFGPSAQRLAEVLRPILPAIHRAERAGSFELLLLSRWRIEDVTVDRTLPEFPVTGLRLCHETCVEVVALHAARPLEAYGAYRARQFEIAARLASTRHGRVALLGDLNCTPWSPAFAALLHEGGLRDAAAGALWPTWFSRLPLLGLPIDHVLVGTAVGVRAHRVGEDVGSDHYPVLADLVVERSRASSAAVTPQR